ncbi:hypothetical protein Q8A67_016029 [Cirrhinus molitorella]|uniref:LRAT domain-containing protein n=1 Tax=Cirrhinus molitorella TaxID=172907 RepID=A0AA88PM62_9TELE|nr:hypothetical protein Q8A67_016029 [Cirrhinus molitorella]
MGMDSVEGNRTADIHISSVSSPSTSDLRAMEPKLGDLIEISRGLYKHWAIYVGNGYVSHLVPPSERVNTGTSSMKSIPDKATVKELVFLLNCEHSVTQLVPGRPYFQQERWLLLVAIMDNKTIWFLRYVSTTELLVLDYNGGPPASSLNYNGPFKRASGNGRGLRYVINSVASYLIQVLGNLYMAKEGLGGASVDIWISDEVQKRRVERLFPQYRRNDRLPIETFKGPDRPIGNLVGCRSLTEFCHEVCSRKGFRYPHTFGRALDIVRSFSKDPEGCLLQAMSSLKFFPQIRYWDEHRNIKASWNLKDFVELYKATEQPSAASRAASYLGDVCSRLDQMELTFSRNLRKYKAQGMPWLERCVARLPKEQMLTGLVFLSCVGLLMNGEFIHFERLTNLIGNLPVTQRHLQDLGILSKLLLLHNPKVWRFHESVPYKVQAVVALPASREVQRRPRTESSAEEQVEEDVEAEVELIIVLQTATVPANALTRWTEQETSFVDLSDRVPHSLAYANNIKQCRDSGIPVCTLESFKRKRRRLLAAMD